MSKQVQNRSVNISFYGEKITHSLWEGRAYPDMPEVLPVCSGSTLNGEFIVNDSFEENEFVKFAFFGYPESSVAPLSKSWKLYCDCELLSVDLEITVNNAIVFSGPLYLRNHPNCGIGQYSYLTLPAESLHLKNGKNAISIRNVSNTPYAPIKDYYLIDLSFTPSSGKLVNHCYLPDPLDLLIEKERETDNDLLCGVGYELITNNEVPAMIHAVKEDRIGNFILFRLDNALNNGSMASCEEFVSWAELCVKNKIYFSFLNFRAPKHSFNQQTAEKIKAIAGEYLFSVNLHELGLIIDGRKEWMNPFHSGDIETLRQGWNIYSKAVKFRTDNDVPQISKPVVCSVARHVSAANLKTGVDVTVAEIPNNGLTPLFSARGATFCYDKERWGVHIASLWMLNNFPSYPFDNSFIRRNEMLVKFCYLSGARLIYPESGMFYQIPTYVSGRSQKNFKEGFLSPDSEISQRVRQAYRNISRLHGIHKLPTYPRRNIALMQGNLDPFTAVIRKGEAFRTQGLNAPDADAGWDIQEVLLPDIEIKGSDRTEHVRQWLSGSPYGQFDIIPHDVPADKLKAYPVVLVPGWNTMTTELYSSLSSYVENGGTLVMCATQLRTDLKYNESPKFYKHGNAEGLFGVEITGVGDDLTMCESCSDEFSALNGFPMCEENNLYCNLKLKKPAIGMRVAILDAEVMLRDKNTGAPILIRKQTGEGIAYLFTTWDYPGHPSLFPVVKQVLVSILKQESNRHRISVNGDDEVNWFHFENGHIDTLAILNSDWSENAIIKKVEISSKNNFTCNLELFPYSIRFVHCSDDYCLSPCSEECGLNINTGKSAIELTGMGEHQIDIFSYSGQELKFAKNAAVLSQTFKKGKTTLRLNINGRLKLEMNRTGSSNS